MYVKMGVFVFFILVSIFFYDYLGMIVFSCLLYGKMYIRVYDWVDFYDERLKNNLIIGMFFFSC